MLSSKRFLMDAAAIHRLRTLILTPLFFFAAAGLPQPAVPQNIYGAAHGAVTDTTEAAIPGATVSITNTGSGITTTTATADSHGYYAFRRAR
jgi:Carboxypeptidase regulatory-like domain